jgi:hypothetical protein
MANLRTKTIGTLTCLICALVGMFAPAAYGQDFSADLISKSNGNVRTAKIYAAHGKLRLDVPPYKGMSASSAEFTLWSIDGQFWQLSGSQAGKHEDEESEEVYGLLFINLGFQPTNDSDLCSQYFAYLKGLGASMTPEQHAEIEKSVASMDCRDSGIEMLEGRVTHKLTTGNRDDKYDDPFDIWVDPKLHAVLKIGAKGFSEELHSIRERTQPAEMFKVPASAQRM